ncbi:DUF5080 family protein [Staphylococcus xylosus]
MEFLLLIIVFGLYYVVYITSVMYAGGLKLLQLFVYIAVAVLYLIPFFFISNDYNSMQNYLLILNMGVVLYAWMAIKDFWSKPLKIKIEQFTNNTSSSIPVDKYEKIEALTINLQVTKYKAIISSVITMIFMITMTVKAPPQLRSEFMESNPVVWVLFFLIFVIYIVINIVL